MNKLTSEPLRCNTDGYNTARPEDLRQIISRRLADFRQSTQILDRTSKDLTILFDILPLHLTDEQSEAIKRLISNKLGIE